MSAAPRRHWLQTALPFALSAVAVAAWAASLDSVVFATLASGVAFHVVVVFRNRGRPTLRVEALGGTLLTGLLVAALVGPRAGALLVPAALAWLLVAAGLAQNAAVRGRAARALPVRRLPEDEPDTAWSRDRAALVLAPVVLGVAVSLVPAATWTPDWRWGDTGEETPASPPDDAGAGDGAPNRPAPARGLGANVAGDGSVRGARGVGRAVGGRPNPFLEKTVVLEATPTSRGVSTGDLGPLYLRSAPLDGAWREDLSGARPVADADDGRADGWCDLAARPTAAEELDLSVHQRIPEYASTGERLVACPSATSAVDLPAVRASPGDVVLTRGAGPLDYRLVARLPARVAFPRSATAVVRPAGAAPRIVAPAELVAAARAATASAKTDLDRVRAVVRHLRANFEFDADSGGDADLADFVAQRRGTCLQFAEAGVAMLANVGVPARVATGWLAEDWDAARSLYVVRGRDSHAWIEVNFQGCGWTVFDPTPGVAGDTGDGPMRAGFPMDGLGDWPAPADRFDVWRVVAELRRAFDRALRLLARNPLIAAAAVLAAAALAARALLGRRRRLAGAPAPAPAARGPWDLLVADLERRGLRRRPSQTAVEFADAVVLAGGDALRPLVELTSRRQAARFGARPLTPDDERAIESFRAALGG